MVSLSCGQVLAWRLSQHSLLQRTDRKQLLEVFTCIGGVQSQLMSAAELSLWARVEGHSPADGTATTLAAHLGKQGTFVNFLHGTWCAVCVGEFHLPATVWSGTHGDRR